MAGLRFLPLLAIAACADLSGLNGLEVSDGATAQDASPQDATDDTTADDADAIVPLDAQNVDGITPPTFCQTQNQTYTWCADFDEGDVVYVPIYTFHAPRFHGPGPSCRLAINGYPNIAHLRDADPH